MEHHTIAGSPERTEPTRTPPKPLNSTSLVELLKIIARDVAIINIITLLGLT
jgi:hypothetical protein